MGANSLSPQVPATTLAACVALTSAGLAPSDPRILTVVLVQSCMPAAQNLVMLANAGPDASRAAPPVSRLSPVTRTTRLLKEPAAQTSHSSPPVTAR